VLSLPPVTEAPTDERHPGKFVWHDLLTPDPEAARRFYGALFGWSFREAGDYVEIRNGGRKLGGILEIRPRDESRVTAQWLSFMSVADVEDAARRAEENGGKVVNGPMDLGPRGRGVLIADPEGAQLLLLRAARGDPPDREPRVGEWLWNEVWTVDPQAAARFYVPLGGYEDTLEGPGYVILINEGRWRAGIRDIADEAYAGRWVPVVRVRDPQALLQRVEALGGVVWVAPDDAPGSGDTALISDPAGALLILQRWDFAEDSGDRP
jgi:predicted enzyme related to lactoylglutathione lyase